VSTGVRGLTLSWGTHVKRELHKLLLIACAISLSGCAAREFTPVAMSQPGDSELTCPQIKQQIADNSAAEAKFQVADKQVEQGNVAKGIGSAIPVAGILIAGSTDLSNEEQVKARALADRNEQLQNLAKQKGCSP
jgi:hypothetical protein